MSSHELNQPGTYQDVTDTTVVAQFKAIPETLPNALKNEGDIHLLAWTTTPWTLPSNTALTVGPKIEYVLVKTFNQYTFEPINVILAKALLSKQFNRKYEKADAEAAVEADKIDDKMKIRQDLNTFNFVGIGDGHILDPLLVSACR